MKSKNYHTIVITNYPKSVSKSLKIIKIDYQQILVLSNELYSYIPVQISS